MAERNNIMSDDIVLFQILPRLPARSIGRFMSVCKQWHSFLTTPEFTKMHIHHVNNQNQPKILAVSATNPCNYFRTIDCETPEVGLSAKRFLPFETNYKEIRIISSLNGLVCVGIDYLGLGFFGPSIHKYSDIILWNPLTGDYKTLSEDNSHGNCFRISARGYGLYYSSCDDDYKLLRVTQSGDAYIYSLKSDSWRKAKSRVDSLLKNWHPSCLLNGKLYFSANKGTQGRSSGYSSLIIRFDTKTEMFTEIATPSSSGDCYSMTVVGGCIHLCLLSKIDNGRIKLELWKMDRDGEWTKVMHSCKPQFLYQPCHLMKNGNWLLHYDRYVWVYKVDRKKAKEVLTTYTMDRTMLLLNGKFVETIVSLKQLSPSSLSPTTALRPVRRYCPRQSPSPPPQCRRRSCVFLGRCVCCSILKTWYGRFSKVQRWFGFSVRLPMTD